MSQRQSKIDSIVRLIEHPGTPYREREAAEAAYYRITKTAYVPNRPAPAQPQRQSFWSRSKPKEETPQRQQSRWQNPYETPKTNTKNTKSKSKPAPEYGAGNTYQNEPVKNSYADHGGLNDAEWQEVIFYDAWCAYEAGR